MTRKMLEHACRLIGYEPEVDDTDADLVLVLILWDRNLRKAA